MLVPGQNHQLEAIDALMVARNGISPLNSTWDHGQETEVLCWVIGYLYKGYRQCEFCLEITTPTSHIVTLHA
jgi:hypothetical protein